MKTHDVQAIAGRAVNLCPECMKLLTHAFIKRTHCPMNPKPACKHCPSHCYHPTYRAQIREVMRFSGARCFWRVAWITCSICSFETQSQSRFPALGIGSFFQPITAVIPGTPVDLCGLRIGYEDSITHH